MGFFDGLALGRYIAVHIARPTCAFVNVTGALRLARENDFGVQHAKYIILLMGRFILLGLGFLKLEGSAVDRKPRHRANLVVLSQPCRVEPTLSC